MESKEEYISIVKLSTKNQVSLTKDVRDFLNVEEGDKIIFIKKDDELIIRKA